MEAQSTKPLEILIVTADPLETQTLRRYFKDQPDDFEVHQVRDGIKALDYLQNLGDFEDRSKPDLLIINPDLPNLDGYQVLNKLEDMGPLNQIPRIIMELENPPTSENVTPKLTPFFSLVEAYFKKQQLDKIL